MNWVELEKKFRNQQGHSYGFTMEKRFFDPEVIVEQTHMVNDWELLSKTKRDYPTPKRMGNDQRRLLRHKSLCGHLCEERNTY